MDVLDAGRVRRIVTLLSRPSEVSHVHLCGLPSSSVSPTYSAVISALRKDKHIVLLVNCLLVNGSLQYFLSAILSRIPDLSAQAKIASLDDLFNVLLSKQEGADYDRSLVIAISRAEELRKFPASFVVALFQRLKKELGRIKVLTSSHLPWTKIEATGSISRCVEQKFESYTKEVLIELLQKRFPASKRNDVKIILDSTYGVCRDLQRLEHVIEGSLEQNEHESVKAKRMKLISHVIGSVEGSHLEIEGDLTFQPQNKAAGLPKSEIVLLMGAHYATYHLASADARHFAKSSGKEKVSSKKTALFEKVPKSFDLQRLYVIYLALLNSSNSHASAASNVYILVNDLCSLGLLVRTSADGNLDVPRYKSIASDECVKELAKSIGEEKLFQEIFVD